MEVEGSVNTGGVSSAIPFWILNFRKFLSPSAEYLQSSPLPDPQGPWFGEHPFVFHPTACPLSQLPSSHLAFHCGRLCRLTYLFETS